MTSTLVVSDAAVDQALTSLSAALDRLRGLTFKTRSDITISGEMSTSQLVRPNDQPIASGPGNSNGFGVNATTTTTSSSSSVVAPPRIVEWHDVAAQRFARLALTTFIEWSSVVRALQEVYASITSTSSTILTGPIASSSDSEIKIAGEYGIELVLRVLKRFQRFEFEDDKAECVEWCQRLEGMVQAQIVKCQAATAPTFVKDPVVAANSNLNSMIPGLARPIVSRQPSPWIASEKENPTTPAASPVSIQDPTPRPAQPAPPHISTDSSPNVRTVVPSNWRPQEEESPQASNATASLSPEASVPELTRTKKRSAQAAQLDQVQVSSPQGPTAEVNKDPGFESTDAPRHARKVSHSSAKAASPDLSSPVSASGVTSKQSADFPVGSVVLAKGLEGREPSSWTPSVVFDAASAPVEQANILGKHTFASLLVAVLGTETWHWIPAYRLKPPSPSHISRLTKDLDHRLSHAKKSDSAKIQHLRAQLNELKLAQDTQGVERWIEARKFGGDQWNLGGEDAGFWLSAEEGEGSQSAEKTQVCSCRKIWQEEELIGCENGKTCKGFEWYHAACVGLDPNNVPDKYYCQACTRA
ncbi:BQ2448_7170 [Microbotryum intermedium]|uniref:BQ2448_7170 protein n=1 Tax=Microbotryum intermedium TaxID=269621 RepID=A0A238FJB2_9BASI|nr:BQ2448_7170 [Microbotryum intermedium]